MTDTYASTIVKDVKTYEIVYDLIQKTGDPVLNIPITFPEGSDWQSLLSIAKEIKVNKVNIRVKPLQNMVIADADPVPGYVSGDFNTYLVIYPGNTYKDDEGMTISTAAISGTYVSGTRTTAINGKFPDNEIYDTYTPAEGDSSNKLKEIGYVDADKFTNKAHFFQSGKVVVGIKPEEFPIANTTTTAGAVRRQIADKIRRYGKEEECVDSKKRQRRNENPTTQPVKYVDEPIKGDDNKDHLYVKWAFQLETTCNVSYNIKAPAPATA